MPVQIPLDTIEYDFIDSSTQLQLNFIKNQCKVKIRFCREKTLASLRGPEKKKFSNI
jgi:hypothetical protein